MSLFEQDVKPVNQTTIYPIDTKTIPVKEHVPGTPGRKPGHLNKNVTAKHAAFKLLREAGAGPTQAAKILGYTPAHGTALEKKLNAYEIERDKLLSLATQTTKKFIQGKPVGQVVDPTTGAKTGGVQPKGSDVMRAVELVMDREQPKVNLTASISAEFLPIDINDYI